MEVLLSAGANPLLQDRAGKTAIDWCELDNPCHEVLIQSANKPRPLVDLCRKHIVERFYEIWVMGCDASSRQDNRIDELLLPDTLKSFLRFQEPKLSELLNRQPSNNS